MPLPKPAEDSPAVSSDRPALGKVEIDAEDARVVDQAWEAELDANSENIIRALRRRAIKIASLEATQEAVFAVMLAELDTRIEDITARADSLLERYS